MDCKCVVLERGGRGMQVWQIPPAILSEVADLDAGEDAGRSRKSVRRSWAVFND